VGAARPERLIESEPMGQKRRRREKEEDVDGGRRGRCSIVGSLSIMIPFGKESMSCRNTAVIGHEENLPSSASERFVEGPMKDEQCRSDVNERCAEGGRQPESDMRANRCR
jgi:hypothetical protein